MVWDYLSGVDCVKDIVVPGLRRSVVGLKLVDSEDVGVPAWRSPLVARSSGGQATLTDSAGLAYEVLAVTQLIQVQGSPGLWMASVTAYRSRPEDLAAMARLVEAVGASMRVDPGSRTADEVAQIISETFAYQTAVYDPDSGQVWNVPAGAESYWRRGFDIWGSATTSAPAPDPDFVELLELGG